MLSSASARRGACARPARAATSRGSAIARPPSALASGPPRGRSRAALRVRAHAGMAKATGLKTQGFVGEMRKVAMKLHTREQAPKEGGTDAPKPQQPWAPTLRGYLRFLTESKEVYDAFEGIMAEASDPSYKGFQNTGLERSSALAADIEWLRAEYALPPCELSDDGPGRTYAALLRQLAADDPPAFICHYYNFYFAHTAGGRMIGSKLAAMLLGGRELAFYQWPAGDVAELLDAVRARINALAEQGWDEPQRARCLEETAASFKWSGGLLQCITAAE